MIDIQDIILYHLCDYETCDTCLVASKSFPLFCAKKISRRVLCLLPRNPKHIPVVVLSGGGCPSAVWMGWRLVFCPQVFRNQMSLPFKSHQGFSCLSLICPPFIMVGKKREVLCDWQVIFKRICFFWVGFYKTSQKFHVEFVDVNVDFPMSQFSKDIIALKGSEMFRSFHCIRKSTSFWDPSSENIENSYLFQTETWIKFTKHVISKTCSANHPYVICRLRTNQFIDNGFKSQISANHICCIKS